MNILVTGANGQLGNEIQVIAKEHPEHIYFFTDVKELDICDRKAILDFVSGNDINLIINCAAFTAVDKAEMPENRMLCDKLNRVAPQYLAEAIQKNGGALIQISTDYVFDGQNYIPYSEEDQTHAASVYGATKLAGEIAAQAACEKVVIIRTAWLYSIFGNNFVKTMLKLGREREELSVVFDQIGTPTYAYDLAKAIFAIVSHGVVPGTYHFSDEGVCSWYDFTKAIFRFAKIETCRVKPVHTEEYPTLAKRPHYSVLDKTKIKSTFGIEIPQWEDSLLHCLNRMNDK
jgi:dTDP-4-dehydrorhamnose reductase